MERPNSPIPPARGQRAKAWLWMFLGRRKGCPICAYALATPSRGHPGLFSPRTPFRDFRRKLGLSLVTPKYNPLKMDPILQDMGRHTATGERLPSRAPLWKGAGRPTPTPPPHLLQTPRDPAAPQLAGRKNGGNQSAAQQTHAGRPRGSGPGCWKVSRKCF